MHYSKLMVVYTIVLCHIIYELLPETILSIIVGKNV